MFARTPARLVHRVQVVSRIPARQSSSIYVAQGETCYLAYHPDRELPYSSTRALPKQTARDESVLKVNSAHMITKAPNLEQIQALTYTPPRFWHQHRGIEKRQQFRKCFDDNVDRPGLSS